MINQRNLEKVALVDLAEKPAKWISKFGSITFNQIGRDLPYGGMNENGLVVEQMTLDQTVYLSRDNRSGIGLVNGYNINWIVNILREHLERQVPIGKLCELYNMHPNLFYLWKKELFSGALETFSKSKNKCPVT